MVRRIFAEYLAGRGLFAIAEGLTRDRVPSPSQHDTARNPHRTGQGWAKAAVRAILRNPRYTGRQVWNKQRKDEILLDVNDVARGYETRLRWNDTRQWVWSETIAQDPLVCAEDFEAAQAIMADAGRARRSSREAHQRITTPTSCAGACTAATADAGCKASTATTHPITGAVTRRNTPSPATSATPATSTSARPTSCPPSTDGSPSSSRRTSSPGPSARQAAQAPAATAQPAATSDDTRAIIDDCDARLARYQAALDAGADPQTVAEWTRQVKTERAAALARDASQIRRQASRRLTEDDIRALIISLGDLRDVIRAADPAVKAAIYEQLGLKVTYLPGQEKIRADVTISPEKYVGAHRAIWGNG